MGDVTFRDAAYAVDIDTKGIAGVGGYLNAPNAFHAWTSTDWHMFPHLYKLPIWVAGENGADDADEAVRQLHVLGVQSGVIALDMEERKDITLVINFGRVARAKGFKTFVYGSKATLFEMPSLNGYWVADWTRQPHMYDHLRVRMTQYAPDIPPGYDESAAKEWIRREMWL